MISGVRLLSVPEHLRYNEDEFIPDLSRLVLSKHLRYLSTTLDHFWTCWCIEYLTELKEHHRQVHKSKPDTVSVGDVIIVHDDGPRGFWRLGIIERTAKLEELSFESSPVKEHHLS